MGLAVPVVNALSLSRNPPPTPEPADAAPGSAGRGSRSHTGGGSFCPGSARLSFLCCQGPQLDAARPGSSPPSAPQGTRGGFLLESPAACPQQLRTRFCRCPGQLLESSRTPPWGACQQLTGKSSHAPNKLLSKSDGTSLPHRQLPGELCRHPPSVGRGWDLCGEGRGGLPAASS